MQAGSEASFITHTGVIPLFLQHAFEAVKRFGEKPENCLVIEDSLNGVKAANAAGCPVWVVPNRVTAGLDFSTATRVLASLEEVAAEF